MWRKYRQGVRWLRIYYRLIKGTHKIHIPGADGVAKDRKKVLQLASDHIGDIVDKITILLPQKYIICTFSASGGTGSGLSVPLMAYLAQIGRICIPAIVLPNDEQESVKAAENSYNACVEIMGIKNLLYMVFVTILHLL